MLDLKLLRREPDAVRASLVRRGDDPGLLDRVLEFDARRREVLPALEALRGEQNAANDAIATAKRDGSGADEAIAAMREVAGRAKALDEELAGIDQELRGTLAQLPNLAEPDAPIEDTPLRSVGEPAARDYPVRDHLDLAGAMIDMERGASLSGARFAYLRGDLVLLELALVRWVLEVDRKSVV